MDLVAKAPKIPVTGETLKGTDFFMIPGGKGANQAVTAAKLGGDVIFIAKLGKDIFALKSIENFKSVNINTRYIEQVEGVSSGVAIIAIDENGRNIIIAVPGANSKLTPADIDKSESDIASAGIVVCQLEVPLETIEYSAKIANKHNVPFILDPAPAQQLSDEFLSMVDVIKPNETEAMTLTGIKVIDGQTAGEAADILLSKGVKNVIITLGEKGFIIANSSGKELIPHIAVKAVDSTAAGDVFTGSLAYGLANNISLKAAAEYANAVAALSVTKLGAQSSIPTKDDVNDFLEGLTA